jgi:outer membrane protein
MEMKERIRPPHTVLDDGQAPDRLHEKHMNGQEAGRSRPRIEDASLATSPARSLLEALFPGRRSALWLFCCVVAFAAVGSGSAPALGEEGRARPVHVGFVVDGPWPGLVEFREQVKIEVLELTAGEFDVRFPDSKILDAGWDPEAVRRATGQLLADPGVDLVIGAGVLASHALATTPSLSKPVIAPIVIDRELQHLPYADGRSGVRNLAYVASEADIRGQLEAFLQLLPFEQPLVILSEVLLRALPELAGRIHQEARDLGLEARVVTAGSEPVAALADVGAATDAVFITPLMEASPEAMDALFAELIRLRLPSFAYGGPPGRERRARGRGGRDSATVKLARRVALIVQAILLGEEAGDQAVEFASRQRVGLNLRTAREIGYSPPWTVLAEAELIGDERESVERKLTLDGVVGEALASNRDLAAKRRAVDAGRRNIPIAWSELFPQAEAGIDGVVIDADRGSPLGRAERTLTGSLSLSQLVFAEAALGNVSIQRSLQAKLEAELATAVLDIALEAALAYLDVLRARTGEEIERNNLELTRANLAIARTRQVVGVAGPAEVYRWESEIASRKKVVIESFSRRQQAELEVNRVLHRPLVEVFDVVDTGLSTARFAAGPRSLLPYTDNPRDYALFSDFLARYSLAHAPELQQFRHAIAAQERALASSERAFWAPVVGFRADLDQKLAESGAGSRDSDLGLPPEFAAGFSSGDNTRWGLGLGVTIPLSRGGRRLAETDQARDRLGQLKVERQATGERVEGRLRAAMHSANASWQGIDLARDASEAARKNLDLVTDAYSRGVVSILELLDAQNAALVSDRAAANAVYDFLADLMRVQRAANVFEFLMEEAAVETWFASLDEYFRASRGRTAR